MAGGERGSAAGSVLCEFAVRCARGGNVANPSAVNWEAPVLGQHEVDIDASADEVWRLHTDVNGWTTWQTDITEARIDGQMEPGASFSWSSFDFPVTSTVYAMSDRERILWAGPPAVSPASTSGSSNRRRRAYTWSPTSRSAGLPLRRLERACSNCSMRPWWHGWPI